MSPLLNSLDRRPPDTKARRPSRRHYAAPWQIPSRPTMLGSHLSICLCRTLVSARQHSKAGRVLSASFPGPSDSFFKPFGIPEAEVPRFAPASTFVVLDMNMRLCGSLVVAQNRVPARPGTRVHGLLQGRRDLRGDAANTTIRQSNRTNVDGVARMMKRPHEPRERTVCCQFSLGE
jgi:hypothetical protein